jgi:ATP synthase protein I
LRVAGGWESCLARSDEPRSNLAVGMDWATRVTAVGLEFVLPPLLGVLVDRWLGTNPLALLTGAVLGFAVGMVHILRIAREGTKG